MKARVLAAGLALIGTFAAPAGAQRLAFDLLVDAEAWKTDAGSNLLARNQGRLLGMGVLHGWIVYRPLAVLEARALGQARVLSSGEPAGELQLLSLRWLPARAFVLEGGKVLLPLGLFGIRRFSNVNPLIGAPDLYPPQYPWGVVASGGVGIFDYRAGAISLPAVNPNYSPKPGHRLRPVAGAGITLGPSFRAGVSMTHGPYLGPDVTAELPAGNAWPDYAQTIVAADLRFSYGYVETRAEVAWSSYEVPTIGDPLHGLGWYAEARVTHTPRLFTALRLEHFRYPFIRPVSASRWIGSETTQMNGEIGAGYRLSSASLIKVSYRLDHWPDEPSPNRPTPDGYAFAVQFSFLANISELLAPRY